MNSPSLKSLLEQQQQTNAALMAHLVKAEAETALAAEPVSVLPSGDEFEQNARLISLYGTLPFAEWRKMHNAVMKERKAKMRRFSRKR